MIDVEMADALFERARELGVEWSWALFDKRVLLPLAALPDAVRGETGRSVSTGDLEAFAADEWFPLLPGAGDNGDEFGAPLYVPSRIGLLLDLTASGYSKQELRCVANLEESLIDNVLTSDESAYTDDDLEMLRVYVEGVIHGLTDGGAVDAAGNVIDRKEELGEHQRELQMLRRYQTNGIPAHRQVAIAKYANRVRAFTEGIRLFMLNEERGRIKAGYSPTVVLRSSSWNSKEKAFEGGAIMWDATLRSALAHVIGDESCRIRVPGFLLEGDRIQPLRTYNPKDYQAAWKEYDLDTYRRMWAELNSERRCLHCIAELPEGSDQRKRYCDERCRNAAKQKRFREQNPDGVFRAQKKYWESVH